MTKSEAESFIASRFDTILANVELTHRVEIAEDFAPTPVLLSDLRAARISGNKIAMIKALRSATGWNLKDSKDWVEAFIEP